MNSKKKIVSLSALKKITSRLRRQGRTIAFTNGCFDILHFGHASYLETAKKNDRILVIGLNSDRSIKKIKGPNRPIISQEYRAALIAALGCVDYVTIFDEATPVKVIRALKPDILVKGADWKGKEVAGSDIVRSSGGKVEFIRFVRGLSSSQIIETIIDKCEK